MVGGRFLKVGPKRKCTAVVERASDIFFPAEMHLPFVVKTGDR
jgi:hypothetical protein